MNYHVVVTPTADAEAMESFLWYAEACVDAAEKWYSGLDRAKKPCRLKPTRVPGLTSRLRAIQGCEVRTLLDTGHGAASIASFFPSVTIRSSYYRILHITQTVRLKT